MAPPGISRQLRERLPAQPSIPGSGMAPGPGTERGALRELRMAFSERLGWGAQETQDGFFMEIGMKFSGSLGWGFHGDWDGVSGCSGWDFQGVGDVEFWGAQNGFLGSLGWVFREIEMSIQGPRDGVFRELRTGFSWKLGWDCQGVKDGGVGGARSEVFREFGMGFSGNFGWGFPCPPRVCSAQLSSCTKSLSLNPKSFLLHDKHPQSRCKIQDPTGMIQRSHPRHHEGRSHLDPAENPNSSPVQQS